MIASTLRALILAVTERQEVENLIRNGRVPRALVRRFVAGDTLAEAVKIAHTLAGGGLASTLDLLGENVHTPAEARSAVDSYSETLRVMAGDGLEPNISVKLTMLGLDIDEDLTFRNMLALLDVASSVDGFVRVDMEGSAYTERTLRVTEGLHASFPGHVGTVVQAALHRSDRDIERLIAKGIRVRLVKGAYAEPASIALKRPVEVDASFVRLMERLLEHGVYPAIATHDPALIRATRGFAARMGIGPARWEFQMLYGVRREAQLALRRDRYGMRVYVPFGTDWYPYFARRIAERPANLIFVLRQLASAR